MYLQRGQGLVRVRRWRGAPPVAPEPLRLLGSLRRASLETTDKERELHVRHVVGLDVTVKAVLLATTEAV